MRRTIAPGNDGNRYSEGNPGLGVPATVVSAEAANGWQEEIVNTIEAAGLTPSTDEDQLLTAIDIFVQAGGNPASQVSFAVANNVVAPTNVTGLLLNKVVTKAARILYAIDRQTATSNRQQVGELMAVHDAFDDAWRINDTSVLDDAGVTFSITGTGQVQYVSDNQTGASYSGTLKASVSKLNQ